MLKLLNISTNCIFRQKVVTFPSFKPRSFRCFLVLNFANSDRVPSSIARSSSSAVLSSSASWQDTKPLSGRDIDKGPRSSNQRSTFAEEVNCKIKRNCSNY